MADRRQTGLLTTAVAGDEVAFRQIIATQHDDMRRVARDIACDGTLAEEATQAAWVIALKKLGNVNGEENLRSWLVSVAANEAKHVLRKR